jgi:type II secretory pathway component GspD/PulD (secretin)
MKIVSTPLAVVLAALLSTPFAWAQMPSASAKPIQLKPASNAPITLHTTDDAKNIYLAIGKDAGINVLFDPDYQSRHPQIDLTNATLNDALRIVGQVTSTFYKTITPDTIFVAANTHQKHQDLDDLEDQTFYLKHVSQQSEANEFVTALRNILSAESKVYLVASENAIVIRATPDYVALARQTLDALDLPKRAYRLTYTVTDMDGSKPLSTQHFAVLTVSGQETVLKQGSKVPVATGSYNAVETDTKPAGVETQYTYLDIGMNFDSTLTAMGDSAMLKADVEQSSIAPEASGVGAQDPIVRQTSLKGMYLLTPGKPMKIGSLDIFGSTRHLEIEATLEQLH